MDMGNEEEEGKSFSRPPPQPSPPPQPEGSEEGMASAVSSLHASPAPSPPPPPVGSPSPLSPTGAASAFGLSLGLGRPPHRRYVSAGSHVSSVGSEDSYPRDGPAHHRRRSGEGSGGALSRSSSRINIGEISRHVSQSFQISLDIVRAISASEGLVFCQICREYAPASETYLLAACGHRFCRECVAGYLECKVREGQIFPACFYSEETDAVIRQAGDPRIPTPCAQPIAEGDIRELVHPEVWEKHQRFKFTKENRHARPCPYCDSPELGDPAKPEMACGACGKTYCYFHANAHCGKTCTEYEAMTHEENVKTQALISTIAKPCPSCRSPVEKAGGCNQLRCHFCGAHFCWLCGRQVDGGTFPEHFQWWNLKGCPNMQMQEDATMPPPSHVRLVKALSALQVILIGPAAFVLGLAFYTACLPCFLAKAAQVRGAKAARELRTNFTGCISFWGNTLVALLFIPPFLALLILFFVVTFLQVILGSVHERFGCCPAVLLPPRPPPPSHLLPTTTATAAAPAAAGNSSTTTITTGGQAAGGQSERQRALSGSNGGGGGSFRGPGSGLEAVAMAASLFGSAFASSSAGATTVAVTAPPPDAAAAAAAAAAALDSPTSLTAPPLLGIEVRK